MRVVRSCLPWLWNPLNAIWPDSAVISPAPRQDFAAGHYLRPALVWHPQLPPPHPIRRRPLCRNSTRNAGYRWLDYPALQRLQVFWKTPPSSLGNCRRISGIWYWRLASAPLDSTNGFPNYSFGRLYWCTHLQRESRMVGCCCIGIESDVDYQWSLQFARHGLVLIFSGGSL